MKSFRAPRFCEPTDPDLLRYSKVIPDRWIDERFPQRSSSSQGRWRGLRTSQFVRIHLLTLIKGIGSFNRTCRELHHNTGFRRFCRLYGKQQAPHPRQLSDFRDWFCTQQWRELHQVALRYLAELYPQQAVGIVVVDASDLPTAVSKFKKKGTPNALQK